MGEVTSFSMREPHDMALSSIHRRTSGERVPLSNTMTSCCESQLVMTHRYCKVVRPHSALGKGPENMLLLRPLKRKWRGKERRSGWYSMEEE